MLLSKRFFFLLFLAVGMFITACSPPETTENENSCRSNKDCKQGYRCVRLKCQKVAPINEPPIADAGKKQRVRQKSKVQLDGSASKDPDGDKITFSWSLVSKPEGSQAALDDPTIAKPTFIADKAGKYIAQLIVKDAKGQESAPAQVRINVYGADVNGNPIADAGTDQIAGIGSKVQLDGSKSTDPDGDPLTFSWKVLSQPTSSQIVLKDADTAKPSFVAQKIGRYVIQLIVDDGLEKSTPDTVTIEVINDFNLVPQLTKIEPNEGYANTTTIARLTGKSFSRDAIVLFNNSKLDPASVKIRNASSIEVALDLNTVAPGVYDIKVRNPNHKETAPLKFTVKATPTPKITKLTPDHAGKGMKLTLTITGEGFLKLSEVLFDTTILKTTFKNDKELTAALDLSQTFDGKYDITVRNPGGKISNSMKFQVLLPGPAPTLKVLNPPSGVVGTKIPFSVHGQGFSPGAVIYFAGQPIPSSRIRRDQINAVPYLDLTKYQPGKYKVQVRQPDGVFSKETEIFTVISKTPTPKITQILPFTLYLSDSNKIAIYGENILKGAKLHIGSNEFSAPDLKIKSDTYAEIIIDTTKGNWKPGDVYAFITNPSGKTSNKFRLTLTYKVPSITSLMPGGWSQKCDTTVNIYGTNFGKQSKVLFDSTIFAQGNSTNPLTLVSDKHLRFPLKATKLKVRSYTIFVDNGPNAKSNKVSFPIISANSIPTPVIYSMKPTSGGADTIVSVSVDSSYSNYFMLGAYLEFDGVKQKTVCTALSYRKDRCRTLTAQVDLTGIKPGKHKITVSNPCGVKSASKEFLVNDAPTPWIAEIEPSYTFVGTKTAIKIKGKYFSSRAKLFWDKKAITVKSISDKEIVTQLMDFTNAQPKVIDVQVDNTNNHKTQIVKFTILAKKHPLYISSLSETILEKGKVYKGINIMGSGFTTKTEIYFDGQKIPSKFQTPSQIIIDLNLTQAKSGTHYIYAKENNVESNHFPFFVKFVPPPFIDHVSPTSYQAGKSFRIYVYGRDFCKFNSSRRCISYPTAVVTSPKGKQYTNLITFTYSYNSSYSGPYMGGNFNATYLKPGTYKIQLKLATGELSNVVLFELKPAPAPVISSVSPGVLGLNRVVEVSIRGSNFVQGAYIQFGLQVIPTRYDSSRLVYAKFDTHNLPQGTYSFVLINPDGQSTKPTTISVMKQPPPLIIYTSPDVVIPGKNIYALYIYGINFDSSGKVYLNGKLQKASFNRGSSPYFKIYNWTPSNKTDKPYLVQIVNSDGQKSNTFAIGNFGLKPYISSTYPTYFYSNQSRELKVYVDGHDSTATVLVNGSAKTIKARSSYYIRVNYRAPSVKTVTDVSVQVKNGNGKLSNIIKLSVLPSSSYSPYISSFRSSVYAGEEKLSSFTYAYGRGFTRTMQVYFDGKPIKWRYSSTSRFYLGQTLDFTKIGTPGIHYLYVKKGSSRSNLKALHVKTRLISTSRTRITSLTPAFGKVGKKITVTYYLSSYNSSAIPYYQLLIKTSSGDKFYSIKKSNRSGYYTSTFDTAGWKSGIITLHIQNKVTKVTSGGSGFYLMK